MIRKALWLSLVIGLGVSCSSFAETRVGIIGLDTSHAIAFTKIMNVEKPAFCQGFRVTAAYQWGSRDIVSATNRYPAYCAAVQAAGVKLVPTLDALLAETDVILLETNDGREHLAQALKVFEAGKLVFIDKPIAHDYADARKIYEAGLKYGAKYFSSSALRYSKVTQEICSGKYGRIIAGDFYAPSPVEEQGTHSRYAWYGIHGFEPLVAVMGLGAESVRTIAGQDEDVVVVSWPDGRVATLRARMKRWEYGGTVFPQKGKCITLGGYEGYGVLLEQIVQFFKTGKVPVANEETLEIFAVMDAAERSRDCGGEKVLVSRP